MQKKSLHDSIVSQASHAKASLEFLNDPGPRGVGTLPDLGTAQGLLGAAIPAIIVSPAVPDGSP